MKTAGSVFKDVLMGVKIRYKSLQSKVNYSPS